MQEDPAALREAVERLHCCKARLHEAVRVVERFHGAVVWDGVVHVFTLQGHQKATVAYAWSAPVAGTPKRKVYAVLGIPPVESPLDAVRAAIVSDTSKGEPP